MPEIPRELVNSVAILLSPGGRPVGSGFVVHHISCDGDFFHSFYLVTCDHCVEETGAVRFCTKDLLKPDVTRWRRPASGDDVVALDITDFVSEIEGCVGAINTGLFLRRAERFFDVGVDLYMMGLLVDDEDIGENLPRARFGNLSAFADERVQLEQGNGAKRPCHLADMRSRTGFSGSPVIGYIEIPGLDGHVNYQNRLMGVHSAQHSERIRLVSEGHWKDAAIPSSMTRIVPAAVLHELIEHDPVLISERDERKRQGPGQPGLRSPPGPE